jgi:hypothetical protein
MPGSLAARYIQKVTERPQSGTFAGLSLSLSAIETNFLNSKELFTAKSLK